MKTSDGQFKSGKPINEIVLPYDQIKAYDVDTEMTLELHSENERQNVDSIAFFVLANDKEEFTSVTDYSVSDGVVKFKIPQIEEDKYYPQIMDSTGKVYSSANGVFIDVVYNPQSRALEIFPIIKEQIIDAVTPQIKQYVMDNKHQFTGEQGKQGIQGKQGEKGEQGPRGFQGNRGPKGEKGDKGDKGEQGIQGPRGFQGNRGPKGDPFKYEDFTEEQIDNLVEGLQDGVTGPQGPQGPRGLQGEQGPQGPQGPQGEKGADGSVVFEELTTEQLEMLTPNIKFELDDNGDLYYEVGSELDG